MHCMSDRASLCENRKMLRPQEFRNLICKSASNSACVVLYAPYVALAPTREEEGDMHAT